MNHIGSYFVESFLNADSLKGIAGTSVMAVVSLFTGEGALHSLSSWTMYILGAGSAIFGLLRMMEMYRVERIKRKQAERNYDEHNGI
jgi:FtsH-binding integral membrane protein